MILHALPEHPEFGAFHTAEVPYLFGTLDALPRPWTATDRRVSDAMMSCWANFAARGDPNGNDVPRWSPFEKRRPAIIRLGERIEPREPLAAERFELSAR